MYNIRSCKLFAGCEKEKDPVEGNSGCGLKVRQPSLASQGTAAGGWKPASLSSYTVSYFSFSTSLSSLSGFPFVLLFPFSGQLNLPLAGLYSPANLCNNLFLSCAKTIASSQQS